MNSGDKTSRGRGITREALIRKALEIVDSDGLEALSMRRLGAEMGVDPMAAYRHLPNKEALLDGVMEAVVTQIDLNTDETLPWQDQVKQLILADLRAMLAHPNVLPLLAQRPLTTPESLKLVERVLEILEDAGVPTHQALLAINVMGFLITNQAMAMSASARDGRSSEELFELFSALPRDKFPRIIGAIERGEFIEHYDQLLEFWANAMIVQLEIAAAAALPTKTTNG